ncbi:6-bladed beta-propeller [Bacteroides sp. UBA939]|uniref:6-bladed beta-propeller n=1 Tax=Bacteroides sp. UBA939 TaxID=1946092 RepID=UPI0025B97415|nr:6-bladed beta-propeller [Bacteroides sp. UBA939]
MKYNYCVIFCVCFMFCGCSTNKKQKMSVKETDTVSTIHLSDNVIEVSQLPLSEAVAKVETVPLEMTDESIVASIDKIHVTDSDIWIKHYKDERILRFSRSGKFLNLVGKIGQGPDEYIRLFDFNVDEKQKEVYIISILNGVKVYDFEGNYKRRMNNVRIDDLILAHSGQFVFFDQSVFISQNLCMQKPISNPKDSLWSIALSDSAFHKEKIFKNPAHIGKEELLVEHRSKPESFDIVNYWTENYLTAIDTYNNELTLKYPDTDTVYLYDAKQKDFIPQYSIFTKEEKGDYELTHLWIKDRKAFSYFTITNYYPTKDYIYLIANKGEDIYTYCYNKKDGTVRCQIQESKIVERKLPWFSQPHLYLPRPFILKDDLIGGNFTVDHRSYGKYWIDVLEPNDEEYEMKIEEVKTLSVKDNLWRERFVGAIENMDEDSNPILVIATLK